MLQNGLFVRLEAAEGQEEALADFLEQAQGMADNAQLFASRPSIEQVDILASK